MRIPHVNVLFRVARFAMLLSVVACEVPTLPQAQLRLASPPAYAVGEDDGMRMRAALRNLSAGEQEALVRSTQNVVVVGFRRPGRERGVSARGERLVDSREAGDYLKMLEPYASRILYRFKNMPAVAVELRDSRAAVELSKLGWIDYVVPNTAELTHDDLGEFDGCYDPLNGPQVTPWAVTRIKADLAWAQATGTNGAILIIDDGLDLSLNPSSGYAEIPWMAAYEVLGQTYDPEDGSHGTPVLSVAGARNNGLGITGIAPGAVLHFGDLAPGGITISWQNAAAAIIDFALPETKVISISYSSKQTYLPAGFVALHDAITAAYYNRGILVVASTGNQASASIQAYPARWSEVIGVGGSGLNDEYVYNNYASGNVDMSAPAVDVDVVCKGAALRGWADGTSFATPAVAGALMLMRQKYPSLSNGEIRNRLALTAVPMASTLQSGAGRINILAALNWQPSLPLMTVTINGDGYVKPSRNCTYFASTANGSGEAYAWRADGVPVGDGTMMYVHPVGQQSFTLEVTVTNSLGQEATGQKAVTVGGSGSECFDW